MKGWINIISVPYPIDAHLLKIKLESEDISVQITDELTVQVYALYSHAIGGVKIWVQEDELQKAHKILTKHGYFPEKEKHSPEHRFHKFTSKLPLISFLAKEVRLIITISTLLILISIPIILLHPSPSTEELLTQNSWCIEQIIINGEIKIPQTKRYIQIEGFGCPENLSFSIDGTAYFPGINSNGNHCSWELIENTLLITPSAPFGYKSYEQYKDVTRQEYLEGFPYCIGEYSVNINRGVIRLESDSVIIKGIQFRYFF